MPVPFTGVDRELLGVMPYRHALPGVWSEIVEESPYFWWKEHMKRNVAYAACCRSGGTGPLAYLYDDWGDIFAEGYDDNWSRGAMFEELASANIVQDREMLNNLDLDQTIVISCPTVSAGLPLSKKAIYALFTAAIESIPAKHDHNHWSTAAYRIIGNPDPNKLKEGLCLFDARKADPEIPLHEVARRLILDGKQTAGMHYVDKRDPVSTEELRKATQRLLTKATKYVETSIGRAFPSKKLICAVSEKR